MNSQPLFPGIRGWMAATLKAVEEACEECRSFLRREGLECELFPIELLLREALTNAVVHGAKGIEHATVVYELRLEHDCVRIEVTDPGNGFDWRAASWKSCTPAPNGRGLPILATYSSTLCFNECGNVLVLTRTIPERCHA